MLHVTVYCEVWTMTCVWGKHHKGNNTFMACHTVWWVGVSENVTPPQIHDIPINILHEYNMHCMGNTDKYTSPLLHKNCVTWFDTVALHHLSLIHCRLDHYLILANKLNHFHNQLNGIADASAPWTLRAQVSYTSVPLSTATIQAAASDQINNVLMHAL